MNQRMLLLIFLVLVVAFSAQMMPAAAQADTTATPASVIAPVHTNTPRPDGSLIHEVGFGQTLADIARAYNVTVSDIQRYNGLPPDSTTLYSGQKLLIRPRSGADPALAQPAANTPAPTLPPTGTNTAEPAEATLVAPASGERQNNDAILPIAGALILLGGFLLLAAALVLRRRK